MKKICFLLVLVALLNTACESTNNEVIEEKEPVKIEIQEPEQEEQVPEQPVQEEEVVVEELTEQEKARNELVDKYGEDVVAAWEKLSRDNFFNYIGYKLIIKEQHGPEGEVYYHCYKILDNGAHESAHVGGEYYVYGVFISNEAIFDLVDYHNEFYGWRSV